MSATGREQRSKYLQYYGLSAIIKRGRSIAYFCEMYSSSELPCITYIVQHPSEIGSQASSHLRKLLDGAKPVRLTGCRSSVRSMLKFPNVDRVKYDWDDNGSRGVCISV